LEINHTPSFKTDTPLDLNIKKKLIRDTLKLLGLTSSMKRKLLKKEKDSLLNRVYTG
jgi:tubulin polyglutamylase TTLL6/13